MGKIEINKNVKVIACSGASNTGAYSDLVARKLMNMKQANMLCLARFSIDKNFADKSKTEIREYIALDGCPINCSELTLKQAGIDKFTHINVTDFGIVKGKSIVTDDKINEITNYISKLIANQ